MRFLTSVFVAAILAATQAQAEPEAIEFSDLADPLAVAFEDPYAAMGVDMLNELKLLVQSDEKLAGTDLDEETRTASGGPPHCRAGEARSKWSGR